MLQVTYELADLGHGMPVEVRETRGAIRVRIDRHATLEELIAALNPVIGELLAGGQWFQVWKGEIVTVDSPQDPRNGGTIARLHRGPLVQEGARRSEDGQAHAG